MNSVKYLSLAELLHLLNTGEYKTLLTQFSEALSFFTNVPLHLKISFTFLFISKHLWFSRRLAWPNLSVYIHWAPKYFLISKNCNEM